jgi:hypothetical protein
MKTKSILLAGALALVFASPPALAGDSKTIRVNFSKCQIYPPGTLPAFAPPDSVFVNVGSVSGAVNGPLKVYGQPGSFTGTLPAGVFFLDAKYVVEAGTKSFTAHVGGRFDTNVGEAALNGFISEGWLLGAKVFDEFHATTPGCVAGALIITPWQLPDDDDED